MNLGIAFQLIDDALDYGGKSAKLGKNVGDDFREGKVTLPGGVVLPPRQRERARVLESHARRRQDRRRRSRNRAVLLAKHHAIEDTVGRARHYGAIAKDALALVPDSPMKQALEETVDFCIARAY